MEDLSIKLSDLPDEMLILILRKLSNVEVLCSMMGISQRLNTIASDSIFTSHLTLYFMDKFISPLPDPMLDRLCLQILPQIHHQIKWFKLESRSMKRILLATNYPNLKGLGLYDIDVTEALTLFDSKLFGFETENILIFI